MTDVSTHSFIHCVSIQISISLGEEFLRISRLRKIAVTLILVRIYAYLCSLFSQILEILLNGFDFYFDLFWMSWHWNQLLKYCNFFKIFRSWFCRLVNSSYNISALSHFIIFSSLSDNITQRAANNVDTEDFSNKGNKYTEYKCITSYWIAFVITWKQYKTR